MPVSAQEPQTDKPSVEELPPGDGSHTIVEPRPIADGSDPSAERRKGPRRNLDDIYVPDSGVAPNFTYARLSEYEEVYEVIPYGEEEGTLVSENFLGLVLENPSLDDDQRLTVLQSYPDMIQGQYDITMQMVYPDASRTYEEPFARREIVTEGAHAVLEQDLRAGPYVRVSLRFSDGNYVEFSMARDLVEKVLGNPTLSDEEIVLALKTFAFRLPEVARSDFSSLSAAELHELVSSDPALQGQEFVRMLKVFEQIAAAKAAAPSGKASGNGSEESAKSGGERVGKVYSGSSAPIPKSKAPAGSARADRTRATPEEQADVKPVAAGEQKSWLSTPVVALGVAIPSLLLAGIVIAIRRRKS